MTLVLFLNDLFSLRGGYFEQQFESEASLGAPKNVTERRWGKVNDLLERGVE